MCPGKKPETLPYRSQSHPLAFASFAPPLCSWYRPTHAWYRDLLLQREFEQGFARNLHLVALGDDFRTGASSSTNGRSDPGTFTTPGEGSNNRSYGCSSDRPLRCACSTRLTSKFILACDD